MEASDVISVIANADNTYDGDLKHYFRVVWHAPNITLPYHNLRHMYHVMWETYNGGVYYGETISKRTLRNMLIAALFHDYNHTGEPGNDSVNIKLALKGLKTHLLPMDMDYYDEIASYIQATQFPHIEGEVTLPAAILRDADISYTLSPAWMHMVNFGLSVELKLTPEQMLKGQEPFLKNLKFSTDWAEKKYRSIIEHRIGEVRTLVGILYGN